MEEELRLVKEEINKEFIILEQNKQRLKNKKKKFKREKIEIYKKAED